MIKADLSYTKYLLIAIICLLVFTIRSKRSHESEEFTVRDYPEIKENGILRIATEYNPVSFFVEGDTVSGFHYELIQAFASSMGLETEIQPVMGFEDRIKGLTDGSFDIIAYNMPINAMLKDSLAFTTPINVDKQVLVQRKRSENDSIFIESQVELGGHTLHMVKGSPALLRIHHICEEIADTIYISEVDKYGPEQLIAMVAHGDIDYAVCDENIASVLIDSLPQIDINTAISFSQFYGWAVNKEAPELLDSLNVWLEAYKKTKNYQQLYKKYH